MAINLALRSNNGDNPLTWAQVDNNWQLIQDALNALGGKLQYSLQNINIANACQVDGSNVVTVTGSIKMLNQATINPLLRIMITLNGVIVFAQHMSDYFVGAAYPIPANTVGAEAFNADFKILSNQYPATVQVYVMDEAENYAAPVTVLIENNPCAAPAEAMNINEGSAAAGVLTLNLTTANSSNDFKAQYDNAGVWTDIGTFNHIDGTYSVNINYTITGAYNVRVVDTSTLNVSGNVVNIVFPAPPAP